MRSDIEQAILGMYDAIDRAAQRQLATGHTDQGRRRGITSGKHLLPLTEIIRSDLIALGFTDDEVFSGGNECVLPGWFRPSKSWDLVGIHNTDLICAVELKSISSSFGNNANNRAEEAIGSAYDADTAYRESLLGDGKVPPVLGYVMVVRDCEQSRGVPRGAMEPARYEIDPYFNGASYLERFSILCSRLRKKSLYNAVWLIFADTEKRRAYEPDPALSYVMFLETIYAGLRLHRVSYQDASSVEK